MGGGRVVPAGPIAEAFPELAGVGIAPLYQVVDLLWVENGSIDILFAVV